LLVIHPQDDHDRRFRGLALHAQKGLDAFAVRQAEVEEHHVEGGPAESRKRGDQAVHLFESEIAGKFPEQLEDRAGIPGIVLDQQDRDRAGSWRRGHGSLTISAGTALRLRGEMQQPSACSRRAETGLTCVAPAGSSIALKSIPFYTLP
jgi:hypothetical protein